MYLYTPIEAAAVIYCHSPVLELPPRPRAQVQHAFPELTVYSNYQAYKSPPLCSCGKGEVSRAQDERVPLW